MTEISEGLLLEVSDQELKWQEENEEMAKVWNRFSFLLLQEKPQESAEGKSLRAEIDSFGKEFLQGFRTIRGIFEQGTGEEGLGGIKFEACQLRAHSWNHVKKDVVVLMKMLPGFLKEHPGEYSFDQIKALLWGMLLHDMGYLMTPEEKEDFSWGGELSFVHVDKGVERAEKILGALEVNLEGREDWLELVRDAIRITDSDREGENVRGLIKERWLAKGKTDGETDGLLAFLELSWAADLLSYFTDPLDIPWEVQDLYWEFQARVKKGDVADKVLERNIDKIAQARGAIREEIMDDYENGRLTIFEVKSPGMMDVYEFVASNFLPSMREGVMDPFLAYSQTWFGTGSNKLEENFDRNIERIEVLREIEKREGKKDPYCFCEGAFTGSNLQEWIRRLKNKGIGLETSLSSEAEGLVARQVEPQKVEEAKKNLKELLENSEKSEFWNKVDMRVLGLTETKHAFERLVTPEIRGVLALIAPEKREEALAELLGLFLEKNKGPGGCVRYDMRLSPGAYEGILKPEQIFGAFNKANSQSEDRKLRFVWAIRRDRGELTKRLVDELREYKEDERYGLEGVDFASKETDEKETQIGTSEDENYQNLMELIKAGLLVSLPVAQIFPGTLKPEKEHKIAEIAERSIEQALALIEAAGEKEVRLIGLQFLYLYPGLVSRIIELDVPVVASLSCDEGVLGKDYWEKNDHPVKLLFNKIEKMYLGTANFSPSAIAIEALKALLTVNPQADKKELLAGVEKIFS